MATEYIEILLEKIEKNYFLELLNNKKYVIMKWESAIITLIQIMVEKF